jgi:hypothetical protein
VPLTVPDTPVVVLAVVFLTAETGVVLFYVPAVLFDEVLFEIGLIESVVFCSAGSVELADAEAF